MVVRRRRRRPRRRAAARARRRRDRDAAADRKRPAGLVQPCPPPAHRATRAAARRRDPARPLGRRPRQRRALEPRPQPAPLPQMRRALDREGFDLHPRARAARADAQPGGARDVGRAGGRDVPRGRQLVLAPVRGAVCGASLLDRIDLRVAVSEQARLAAVALRARPLRGDPERRRDPRTGSSPAGRDDRIVFAGRHDQRKGLPVLLRAWPRLRGSGIRLRVLGADPLAVRLLLARLRMSEEGDRPAGLRRRRDADAGARGGEAPRRAVARQRELRHDDHARLRVRDARSSPPTSRAIARSSPRRRARSSRPTIRRPWRTRSRRCSPTSPRGPSEVARRASARRASTRGRSSPGGSPTATSAC